MELFQKKKEVVQGKSKFFTLTNKQKMSGDLRISWSTQPREVYCQNRYEGLYTMK